MSDTPTTSISTAENTYPVHMTIHDMQEEAVLVSALIDYITTFQNSQSENTHPYKNLYTQLTEQTDISQMYLSQKDASCIRTALVLFKNKCSSKNLACAAELCNKIIGNIKSENEPQPTP